MNLLDVHYGKCRRDGICMDVCPARIIEKDDDGYPVPKEGIERLCIRCGHCVAVCPQGALSLQTMGPQDCSPSPYDFSVDFEAMASLMRTRRSIRSYRNVSIERETINRLIGIANYAPSIKNSQPVHWLVLTNRSEIKHMVGLVIDWLQLMLESNRKPKYPRLAIKQIVERWKEGDDLICHDAPNVIAVCGPANLHSSEASCFIALAGFEMAAHSMGLGTCWAGYFYAAARSYPPLKEALCIPENKQCFAAMLIGEPKYRYPRTPYKGVPLITWR